MSREKCRTASEKTEARTSMDPGLLPNPTIRARLRTLRRAAFPTTAARGIIISLELIGGDAVWGDQRKLSFPPEEPEPDRSLGAIGTQTVMSTEIQLRL
jgi:hypothetical protein